MPTMRQASVRLSVSPNPSKSLVAHPNPGPSVGIRMDQSKGRLWNSCPVPPADRTHRRFLDSAKPIVHRGSDGSNLLYYYYF